MAAIPNRILFVDDDPNVLQGLRRMLSPVRHCYEFVFAGGGREALERMSAASPFDVIVTDMRMPGMDGAQLLHEVKERHPETVRIVLSGQSDKEMLLQVVGLAHQYLSKPCDAQTLQSVVARSCSLSELLTSHELKQLLTRLETLPSLPDVYLELQRELQSPTGSIRRVGEIISQDVAMTARILQLANSAFFGLSRPIASAAEATSLLGLDTVRALILSAHIFSQYDGVRVGGLSLEWLRDHSLRTAAFASEIAKAEQAEREIRSSALMAGVLHDVGRLVLAANLPDDYELVLAEAAEAGCEPSQAEQERFGATHAEVGAYLLALWGISSPIVEAVRYHHRPGDSEDPSFSALTAVHVADAFAYETGTTRSRAVAPAVDQEYLEWLGLAPRLNEWRQLCAEAVGADDD